MGESPSWLLADLGRTSLTITIHKNMPCRSKTTGERDIQSKAVVLTKQPVRENDLLVNLLLEAEGMVTSIAFGGGSIRSSRGRCCQPFQELLVYIKKHIDATKQQANYRLVEVQELTNGSLLRNGSTILNQCSQQNDRLLNMCLACAYYVNVCFENLAGQFESPKQSYRLYIDTLNDLKNTVDKLMMDRILRKFEMKILCFLGYDIRYSDQSMTADNVYYCYDLHRGWQHSHDEKTSIHGQTWHNLNHLEKLDSVQLYYLKKHNQKLLNELSHFKIYPSLAKLKSFYVTL